jgi:acetyl esterase/lipase
MKSLSAFLAACVLSCPAIAVAAEEVEIIPDVVYGHKDGLAMAFDVLRPKGHANGAGILSIWSGGWHSDYIAPQNFIGQWQAMLDKGFTVFIVYHGSGTKYLLPDIVDDLRRCVRFTRAHAARFGVDPNRLGAFGCSSGGHLALMLAATADDGDPKAADELLRTSDRLAAVVAYYPPTDIRPCFKTERWKEYQAFRFDPALAGRYSPLLLVTARTAPVLLIHGDSDPLVPLEHSRNILSVLQKEHVPSELLVIQGAGHGFSKAADGRRAAEARNRWFEKYLLSSKP